MRRCQALFQSTRLLRGATGNGDDNVLELVISIHAPLARRDEAAQREHVVDLISIHAPLARRDIAGPEAAGNVAYFNPRASCEARPSVRTYYAKMAAFQSTRLLRGATHQYQSQTDSDHISIHAPLARRDGDSIS